MIVKCFLHYHWCNKKISFMKNRELLNKLINSILTFVLMHCGSHLFPQPEFCTMIVDCCAQQRSYEKFFGLLAQVSFF